MTPEENQKVNAGMRFLENQCANLAREGASAAMLAESLAIQLKAAQVRIAELEKPADNVVPINKDLPA